MTAISTAAIREENPGLPGPTAEYMEHAAAFDDLDWSDRQPLAEFLVRDSHPQGVALAEAVPGATLVTIEGGHELHERDWDQMLDAIARHTEAPG